MSKMLRIPLGWISRLARQPWYHFVAPERPLVAGAASKVDRPETAPYPTCADCRWLQSTSTAIGAGKRMLPKHSRTGDIFRWFVAEEGALVDCIPWNIRRRGRTLIANQRSELCVFDVSSSQLRVLLAVEEVIEAPNWTADGNHLLVNGGGDLWRVSVEGIPQPNKVDAGALDDFNNDHVLSPDGQTIFASSDDGHIYALPFCGGVPRRVSSEEKPHHCYLHGISPDGSTLAYVGLEKLGGRIRTNIFTISASGGLPRRVTDLDLPHDGPEFSANGEWLFFNSERATPGQSQCFRMRPDGSDIQQLTYDERVNWFPHPSPDSRSVVYLSYPRSTQGHPANKDVILRIMDFEGGASKDLAKLTGGQGTINVNSWAPDGTRFAFVSYPTNS